MEGLEIRLNQKGHRRLRLRCQEALGGELRGWGAMESPSDETLSIFEPIDESTPLGRVSPEDSQPREKAQTPNDGKKKLKLLKKSPRKKDPAATKADPPPNPNFLVPAGPVMATRLGTPHLTGLPTPLAQIRKAPKRILPPPAANHPASHTGGPQG